MLWFLFPIRIFLGQRPVAETFLSFPFSEIKAVAQTAVQTVGQGVVSIGQDAQSFGQDQWARLQSTVSRLEADGQQVVQPPAPPVTSFGQMCIKYLNPINLFDMLFESWLFCTVAVYYMLVLRTTGT